MAVLNPDPSLPSNPAPVFADVNAARGDEMRANNNKIWGNFTDLDSRIDANWIRTIYGDNAYGSTLVTDFNAITKSGFYTGYGAATGAPTTAFSWFILHQNSAVGVASMYQRAVAFNSILTVYERVKTSSVWSAWKPAGDFSSPKIEGLIISNNLTDLTNDINISAGYCHDSTRSMKITLASSLIKRLDAPHAAGTNQGMMQSGQTKASGKSYRIYLISNADSSAVDVIATEYNVALVLPSGYTKYRYLLTIRTLASGAIQRFEHLGNDVILLTDTAEIDGSLSAGTITRTISVIPLGLTKPIIRCFFAQIGCVNGSVIVNNILDDGVKAMAFLVGSSTAGDNQIEGYVVLSAAYTVELVVAVTGSRKMYVFGYTDRDREAY
jgi:hypothetical protein